MIIFIPARGGSSASLASKTYFLINSGSAAIIRTSLTERLPNEDLTSAGSFAGYRKEPCSPQFVFYTVAFFFHPAAVRSNIFTGLHDRPIDLSTAAGKNKRAANVTLGQRADVNCPANRFCPIAFYIYAIFICRGARVHAAGGWRGEGWGGDRSVLRATRRAAAGGLD